MNIGKQRLRNSRVRASQRAWCASALTIASKGVWIFRRRSRTHPSDAAPAKRRLRVYLYSASALSCLLTAVSGAQGAATATIVGKVVAPQGAVILAAKVTAVNTATSVSRSVSTTSSGDYAIPSLPPGAYDIKVQARLSLLLKPRRSSSTSAISRT
jgi:hypothetical protein